MIIGDTPQQLGQIEAADAMLIDGQIVTRDDYRALVAQVEALKDWRRLALQFDGHRMQAMSTLKMVATGKFDMEEVRQFIAAAPVSGDKHVAEIRAQAVQEFIQFMYSQDNCQLCNSSLDIASKYADSIRRGEVEL